MGKGDWKDRSDGEQAKYFHNFCDFLGYLFFSQVGQGRTVNPGREDDPAAFDTRIGPLTAPAGTVATSEFGVSTLIEAAGLLLKNVTFVPGPKLEPVIVICAPTFPLVGLNPVMVGLRNATTSV
jgi:hypothetical protein